MNNEQKLHLACFVHNFICTSGWVINLSYGALSSDFSCFSSKEFRVWDGSQLELPCSLKSPEWLKRRDFLRISHYDTVRIGKTYFLFHWLIVNSFALISKINWINFSRALPFRTPTLVWKWRKVTKKRLFLCCWLAS